MQVAICIATFQRPNLLGKLLAGIAQLRFEKNEKPAITVVVIDNDAAKSAQPVCRETVLPWPIHYVQESKRGIASARNRAIRESQAADCIVFIDDDEVPEPLWLDELLWTRANYRADVVLGQVVPVFASDVPDWAKRGSQFTRPVYPTGQLLEFCATNNTLIERRVLDQISAFDEQFELTGGEDTHFFLRVSRSGFRIVFSKEAIVTEAIGKDRANLASVLRRAYRGGNCFTFVERALDGSPSTHVARFTKGCARIAHGVLALLLGAIRGPIAAVRGLCAICAGAGMLAALLGLRYQPYRAVSGD